jgi:AcrR family transcriptional regulator
MYCNFDGQEDLFAYVARVEFERLFATVGPVALPREPGPDAFWSTVERYYLEAVTGLAAHPQLAALVRGWLAASDNPILVRAQHELEQAVMPWIERVLTAGQAGGAVAPPPSDSYPSHGP